MKSKRQVVVTGIGCLTSCGAGWKSYWEAALEGKSNIRRITDFSENGLPVKLAGQIPDFSAKDYIKQRKSLKVMSRDIQLAVAASQLALEDAGLSDGGYDPSRFGVSLGTGVINNDLDEMGTGIQNGVDQEGRFQIKKFGSDGIRSLYPLWFLKYLPNMPACHIAIAHKLQGPNNTMTTSSAAGAQAIGEAFQVIARGAADLMLAGGADSKTNAMGFSRFNLMGFLSHADENPESAYRPFDQGRDGLVLGEGAGLVILEEKEHALKRGATIYGEVAGYGTSTDFNCDPRQNDDLRGKEFAMKQAIKEAMLEPNDIDFLVANGSGIPFDDQQEARAIRHVFESHLHSMKVTAVKPITGHAVYGSGGIEIAIGLLGLKNGCVPPVANLETPDEACDLPFVMNAPQEDSDVHSFLLNSFGFGGQNACLAVKK